MIPVDRFKVLDQSTNVPTADLVSQNTTDLLNTARNDFKVISNNLSNLINSNNIIPIKDELKKFPSELSASFSKLGQVRVTKDFFSSGLNLTATPQAILNDAADALANSNPALSTSLKQLGSTCKNFVLGGMGARKSPKPLITCPNGKSRYGNTGPCNLNQFSSIISAASGGAYSPSIYDQFSLENALSLIGNAGYRQGLCNVFGALTANLSNVDSISRIASNLLGQSIGRQDMLTVMDIGATLTKGNVTSIIPSVSKMIFNNYKQPAEIKDNSLSNFYTGFTASLDKIDPNWSITSSGNYTTNNLGGPNNVCSKDINSLFLSDSTSTPVNTLPITVNAPNVTVTPLPKSSYLYAANQFSQVDPVSSLTSSFPILSL